MENITLEAKLREKTGGKSALSSIRLGGRVPAVVYGEGKGTVHLSLNAKELDAVISKGFNSVVKLVCDGSEDYVMIKDIQRHVVTGCVNHLDFLRISMDKKREIRVPVKLQGIAHGVKAQGGVLKHNMRDVHLKCLPADIPKEIVLDVTSLNINENITVGSLKFDNLEFTDHPERIVASVAASRKEKAEETATPAAAAAAGVKEPEVLKAKKEEVKK